MERNFMGTNTNLSENTITPMDNITQLDMGVSIGKV